MTSTTATTRNPSAIPAHSVNCHSSPDWAQSRSRSSTSPPTCWNWLRVASPPIQLGLTYAAEAAIPLFVLGLYAVQRPQIGRLGLAGAVLYAYAFVFFTGTVMVALVDRTTSWDDLARQFGPWMLLHGAVMVVGGIAFGVAVVRAGVFASWTGWTLLAGVLLVALADSQPGVAQLAAAGIRDAAFIGMGLAALARWRTS